MKIKRLALAALASVALAASVQADSLGFAESTREGAFAEVRDDLKDAIVNRGIEAIGAGGKVAGAIPGDTKAVIGHATAGAAAGPVKVDRRILARVDWSTF